MKRLMLLVVSFLIVLTVSAQNDVVSMQEAAQIFKTKSHATIKERLTKEGYIYKGVSSDSYGKDYNYVRNMDLTSNFLPTRFTSGNSSLITLPVDGSAVYIYVFNRKVFAQLQTQVKTMKYNMEPTSKSTSATIIYTKDNEPTFTFITLQQPLPYCVQITE